MQPAKNRPTCRPQFDALEERSLMTVALTGRVLVVEGTNYADTIRISQASTRTGDVYIVDVNGKTDQFAASKVSQVKVYGDRGNDIIQNLTRDLPMTAYGGEGNDRIYAGAKGDTLFGDEGNDVLYGGAAGDFLFGGDGNDRIYGGGGYDYLLGEAGDDYLDAEAGGGWINGGVGQDLDANNWTGSGSLPTDVIQNGSPTCWFLSTLASLSQKSYDLTSTNRIQHLGRDLYSVKLYNESTHQWQWVNVTFNGTTIWQDAGLPTASGTTQYAANCEGKFWTVLYERAMIALSGGDYTDPNSIAKFGNMPEKAMTMLTGKAADWANPYEFWWFNNFDTLNNAVQKSTAVVASTKDSGVASGLVSSHSYSVWSVDAKARTVTLRNPWGPGDTKEFVTISWSVFAQSFQSFTWVKY